ncbi:MAG: branched-chain amino acid ABC transporter permease [Candidatus Marinimicrobia bacterium]|mgnify:CR=1 FL=1|jgi:branched-chain amino acid transport system permease protein|nr:branched-chain amino acid ABC transporter permease [Candidatus Neomarinimicrobiota bacterium]MDP6611238.1 branched-chain amino acid ABC transporter permease [Candidatus Neomarinimicrobiota bacterium]|tara:strand:+ start:4103 stop:5134 length:1032 start_codon:yes stop_codon:yes gene_type:complete
MKGRYDDENLKWIPILIIAVYLSPFLLKSATFSYKYYLYILNMAGIYMILTVGLDLLSGFTGLMSLGHAAFLAIGAYTSAILVDQAGLPFELSLIITPVIVGLCGLMIGFPALRIEGMYLGLTTMGFGFIVKRLIIAFRDWTGGSAGLQVSKATLFGFTISNDWNNYFMIYTFAIIAIIVARRIVKSKLGRVFMAIRDSEQAAQASGINIAKYKMLSFFISGMFAGFAGVLFAHTNHFISTDHFDILLSVYFIVMVLVGGVGSIYGAVLGTLFIVLMENMFIPLFKDTLTQYMHLEAGDFQAFIFGLIMLLFIIFQPMGLYGMWLKMRIYWKLFPFNPRKRFT